MSYNSYNSFVLFCLEFCLELQQFCKILCTCYTFIFSDVHLDQYLYWLAIVTTHVLRIMMFEQIVGILLKVYKTQFCHFWHFDILLFSRSKSMCFTFNKNNIVTTFFIRKKSLKICSPQLLWICYQQEMYNKCSLLVQDMKKSATLILYSYTVLARIVKL